MKVKSFLLNSIIAAAVFAALSPLTAYERPHTLTGGSLTLTELSNSSFDGGKSRTIRIWLPESYSSAENADYRWPVLYMHDGQNLFDSATAFAGEWKIDESVSAYINAGHKGLIVVGIDSGLNRANEYSPEWPVKAKDFIDNPCGRRYVKFITETVKPYIDSAYRTNPSKETAFTGGSSMGGIISLFAALERPDIFGKAIIFSPALHVYEKGVSERYIKEFCRKAAGNGTLKDAPKLYVYCGGTSTEKPGVPWDEASIYQFAGKIKKTCLKNGYPSEYVYTTADKKMTHSEWAWSRKFPAALEWLIK